MIKKYKKVVVSRRKNVYLFWGGRGKKVELFILDWLQN